MNSARLEKSTEIQLKNIEKIQMLITHSFKSIENKIRMIIKFSSNNVLQYPL